MLLLRYLCRLAHLLHDQVGHFFALRIVHLLTPFIYGRTFAIVPHAHRLMQYARLYT